MALREIRTVVARLKSNVFLRNWAALTSSNFAVQALTVLSSIRITRALSPAGYGEYNIIFVHVGFLVIIAAFGMRQVVVRFVSRTPLSSRNVLRNVLVLRIATTAVSIAGLLCYYQFFEPSQKNYFFLAFVLIVSNIVFDSIEIVVTGLEHMTIPAKLNFYYTLFWVIIVYVLPTNFITVFNLVFISVALQVIKTAVFYYMVLNARILKYNDDFDNDRKFKKRMIGESIPYFWIALLTASTNQLPMLFLFKQSGASEVGYYNLAFKILNPLQLVLANAFTALFPRVSALAVRDEERFYQIMKLSYIFLLVLGISSAFVVTLFRQEAILILYGKAFLESANVIAIQTWFFVLFSFVWLTGVFFGALDRQNLLSVITTIRTVVQLPILWYAARFGASTFSLAYVVCAAFDVFLHWFTFQRILKKPLPVKLLLAIIGSLAAGMFLTMTIPPSLNLLIRIAILLVIMAGTYLIYKYYLSARLINQR
ncbi:MAG: oligosaccharide flippase family protein [Bacteroidota bacterium]